MVFLWALPLGISIGILSGFFGVGGGFILTPVLLLLGFPPINAVATSLLYSMSTSVSGMVRHYKYGNISFKPAVILGLSGMAATQVALPFVLKIEELGYDDIVIPILYLILLGYFALSMLKSSRSESIKQTMSDSIPKIALIGFVAGLASSILGVGGGFIMVPLMIKFLGFPPRMAVGTSLVSIFFIVTAGFISYVFSATINITLGVALVLGALVGAQVGASLTTLYANRRIQFFLSILYLATFLSVLSKLLGVPVIGLVILAVYALALFTLFTFNSLRAKRS
ncbi:sulfite exporter TauE/SafE family protein [Pseudalkalibacillus caeni]|uniref:Probable membrane transporter protein n=1 Tax=Exobacillus caeni TaxID=2574798 RepID=A0A5R9FAA6_9BACL|nr:sulfite exporter TauE/SafE family protein [Pseudalkalibacillus caeni]TLS38578.1 sulfite exporter TauE/SafE family protein [Pseudalkalibacillus caeni]